MTLEESRRKTKGHITRHGWAVSGVSSGPDDPWGGSWAYTVGLLENFDHPELIMTNTEFALAQRQLNTLGERIRLGEDITDITRAGYDIRTVHPAHYESDLLNTWIDIYGHKPEPGQVWQIVVPAGNFCSCHAHLRTDLSDPTQRPGSRRPNRAQRRKLARDRRPGRA